jgi:hypothetical protein
MDALDYWRLCDEVSVIDAALLIVGEDPSSIRQNVENWGPEQRPMGYDAAKTALANAILGGRLPATVRREAHERGYDEEPGPHQDDRKEGYHTIIFKLEPDWAMTTVRIEDLQAWLSSRGFQHGFFSVRRTTGPRISTTFTPTMHPSSPPQLEHGRPSLTTMSS